MIETVILAHPVVSALLGYFVFSAIVTGMPPVDSSSGKGYRWIYASLNVLAANIGGMVHSRFPAVAPIPDNLPAGSAVEHKETTVVVTPKP